MTVTASMTYVSPVLCGWMFILPAMNWHGLVLGGGTASVSTKKTSVGYSDFKSRRTGNSWERSSASCNHRSL